MACCAPSGFCVALVSLLVIAAFGGRADAQAILDVSALPTTSQKARTGYEAFLTRHVPRAYALSPNGEWGYSSQQNLSDTKDAAITRALETCNKNVKPDSPVGSTLSILTSSGTER